MTVEDSYPTATQDGTQIRLDAVKPQGLWVLTAPITTGSALHAGILTPGFVYEFRAKVECIIDFLAVATALPTGAIAVHLLANETIVLIPPANSLGISILSLGAVGKVYVSKYINWAGLANATTLGNQ